MNGILSMPAEQYRSAAGVSKSMLDDIAPPKTPAHFWAEHVGKTIVEKEPTPAQALGTLVHRCILEPDTMTDAFHVKPDGMTSTTKEGKAWRDEHQDRPIITADVAGYITDMRDAVHAHPKARALIAGGKTEQSLFCEDANGVLRKARLDVLSAGNIIPDLKTCASAAAEDMEASNGDYRYFVQAAYYIDLCQLLGIDKEAFCTICVEKEPPHLVAVYSIPQWLIDAGRVCYRRDMALYRHCVETGEWSGYGNSIMELGVRPWLQKQLEQIG